MKEKLKSIWFIMVVVSVLMQTALTFFMLYRKSTDKLLSDVIIVLTIAYILAFLLIAGLSLHSKKISREALGGYKRSQKVVKRVLTLLMLVMSVLNFLSAGGSGIEFIWSIILIVFNLIVIYIDSLVGKVKQVFIKKKKRKEREEKEARVRAYRIGSGQLSKMKKSEGTDEK